MCIGDAISTAVAGPYIASPVPFICQQSLGGSIDPRVFDDADGQPYMIWKSDQNSRSNTVNTQIYSQPLSADGLHLLGQPTVIFGPDESWQGHIVEAPQLVLVRGSYYLFYSGGWFNQPGYSIGAARCTGPLGTVQRHVLDASAGLQLAGSGSRRRVGLLQRVGVLAPLHPVQFHPPAARAAASGLHGPPRLRHRGPVPGGAAGGLRAGLSAPYAPSHAAEPGVRAGTGLAGGEGPGHSPAVPAHHQRPAVPPATRPRTGSRSSTTTRRRCSPRSMSSRIRNWSASCCPRTAARSSATARCSTRRSGLDARAVRHPGRAPAARAADGRRAAHPDRAHGQVRQPGRDAAPARVPGLARGAARPQRRAASRAEGGALGHAARSPPPTATDTATATDRIGGRPRRAPLPRPTTSSMTSARSWPSSGRRWPDLRHEIRGTAGQPRRLTIYSGVT